LYRINTVEIKLPPLRDRLDDIPLLSEHFTKLYAKKYRKEINGISEEANLHLKQYQWPGNVRELQHAIERAVIMTENHKLEKDDFFFLLASTQELPTNQSDNFNLDEIERNVIHRAIEKHSGNISKAAKELGLTRASLYRRLEKHGL
jgi:transcriptional regulator with PAS, ATPase and Fis domain